MGHRDTEFSEIFTNFALVKIKIGKMSMGQPTFEQALARLNSYIEQQGGRKTPERVRILEVVFGEDGFFTVAQLHERVSQTGVRLTAATVYKTVETLVHLGIVGRFQGALNTAVYRRLPGNCHRLVCLTCGKVKLVKEQAVPEVLRARHYSAFTAAYFEMTVYGTCSTCARKAKKVKNNTISSKK